MSQITQMRKKYVEKPIQRIKGSPNGYYWVKSEKHNQLWYKCVLTEDNEKIYCACPFFKHRKEMCKHLMRIMALDAKVV